MICDNCDKGFHTNCHDPPINLDENDGDWFCRECATVEEIGKEEENKMTLKDVMKDIDEEEKNDSQEVTRI